MAEGKLTAPKVRTITEPGTYFDGMGLRLQVTKSGSKTWLFRFQLNGRSREMGLGSFKDVSLAQARIMVADARALLRQGIDPIAHRKASKQKNTDASIWTFSKCAQAFISAKSHEWTNEKHVQQWHRTIEKYCNPVFGDLPVSEINTDLVMRVLEPIWYKVPETASRVRGRIENILSWATVRGYREGANPATWHGHIQHLLPKRNKVQKPKHFPAMPYAEAAAFMAELKTKTSLSAKALQFTILTASRTGSVIGASWKEIDLENGVWTIPAERMKAGREHRVPLPKQAIDLQENLPMKTGWLFPSVRYGRHISNMAMLKVMRGMGYGVGDYVPHGFRSTFRDWCGEQTNFPSELAESALSHALRNKVEAAYQRGDYLEKRRLMMQAWADFCDYLPENRKNPKITVLHKNLKQ